MENKDVQNLLKNLPYGTRLILSGDQGGRNFKKEKCKLLKYSIFLSPIVALEFDKMIHGHSCEGLGKEYHCWNLYIESIYDVSIDHDYYVVKFNEK